jgi:hypothetical protein
MKCEPITDLGFAMAATRAGLRARITRLALTARRTRAMPLFAAFARAVVRAGFARRTVLRTGRLPCIAIRVRAVLRFAVTRRFAAALRFAIVLRFATVLRLATVLRFAAILRFAAMLRFVAVLRFAAMLRFAIVVRFAAAVLRAGLARRTVLRAVVFPLTARRARDGLFFAVRFRDVLDLLNITTYPPQLKVSRPSPLWVNTV